jgi:hypothetical protein
MNAQDMLVISKSDIDASVKSTVDYLGITRASYRMSVISPMDALARESVTTYVDALNKTLKKRFVVRQYLSMKESLLWLRPKTICNFIR